MNGNIGIRLADKELVDKVLRGDHHAFRAIINNTEGLVAQIVFRMITNAEDRKDIAQDIYFNTYKNLSAFKFQSKISTWIGHIAYNTCLNYLKKKKLVILSYENENSDSESEGLEFHLSRSLNASKNETENLLIQKGLTEILKSEIEMLPAVYKTLITLFHQEELSYEEIGQITGMPEGTIKNYLFRARKSLKQSLLLKYKKEEL